MIEEDIDGHGQSQGYVKYRFSNYGANIYGMNHYDESAFYSMLVGRKGGKTIHKSICGKRKTSF